MLHGPGVPLSCIPLCSGVLLQQKLRYSDALFLDGLASREKRGEEDSKQRRKDSQLPVAICSTVSYTSHSRTSYFS